MNKSYSLFFLLFFTTAVSAQTLFTYGNNAVSKEEFLKAYNKNRPTVKDKKQSLQEYLDLYEKFKLKVKDAEDEHLDTLSSILNDVNNFRSQVEIAYMNNDSIVNAMVNEAFQRQQKDIHLLHYYVLITDKMSPADTMIAYNAIHHAYDVFNMIRQKNLYPGDMISEINKGQADYTSLKNGDLGYITAFTLPYQYENIAYGLKPGEVSKPFRSKTGWHFFRSMGERKAIGRWKIAQIFFAIPPGSSEKEIAPIEQKADSIYNLIKAGTDFAALAKKYSQDRNTFMNGGQLPEFGTGKFDTTFESQVFDLKNDSDVSKPFRTIYGFHIVKRLAHSTAPSKTTDAYSDALKQEVLRDSRAQIAKEKFLEDISSKTKYNRNIAVTDADLIRYADSITVNKKMIIYPISNSIIFSFAYLNVTGKDWLQYVYNHITSELQGVPVDKAYLNKYINSTTLEYYKNHLEDYNTDFKYQMQEFKEGNMLFEIMQKNVWNKAAADSVGLLNYYNQHKEKYTWVKSADLIMYNCSDTSAVKEVTDALKSGKDWRTIVKESQGRIQADSNRYELSQIQTPTGAVFKEGSVLDPIINMDNTASLVQVLNLFPENEQRNFADSKGMVINDYQNFIEEQWLARLEKKYPVKVNEKVFNSLLKQ
jgi:peptidyl-prolyl cis-trans isomerase SurA